MNHVSIQLFMFFLTKKKLFTKKKNIFTNNWEFIFLQSNHTVLAWNVFNITSIYGDSPGGRFNTRLEFVALLELLDADGNIDYPGNTGLAPSLLQKGHTSNRNQFCCPIIFVPLDFAKCVDFNFLLNCSVVKYLLVQFNLILLLTIKGFISNLNVGKLVIFILYSKGYEMHYLLLNNF